MVFVRARLNVVFPLRGTFRIEIDLSVFLPRSWPTVPASRSRDFDDTTSLLTASCGLCRISVFTRVLRSDSANPFLFLFLIARACVARVSISTIFEFRHGKRYHGDRRYHYHYHAKTTLRCARTRILAYSHTRGASRAFRFQSAVTQLSLARE